MRRLPGRLPLTLALAAVTAASSFALPASAQGTTSADAQPPLTAGDLLDVASATIADLSDDGRWIALTIGTRRGQLGVDASRDADPSYLFVPPVRLHAVDTRTLEHVPVFADARRLRNATWSPDGTRLAFLELVDGTLRPTVWDRSSRRLTTMRPPAGQYVAENSELRWNGDGTQLLLALRTTDWRTRVQARFDTLVRGPITHLGSPTDEPFLPWEALRREAFVRRVVAWTVGTSQITTRIPEGMVSAWDVSPDGVVVAWNDDRTMKTDYATILGRTERLVARVGSDTTLREIVPTLQGTTVQWSEDRRRVFVARDGAVWMRRIGVDGADTARRRILAPDSIPASDTTAAARARRAASRWSLVRTSARGDAIIASRRDGLYLADTTGALTRIAALPDSTDQGSPRATVLEWSHDGRYVYLALNARDRYDRAVARWDRQTGETAVLARDLLRRSGLRLAKEGGTLALDVAEPNRPSDPWVADAALANPRRVHAANPQLTGRLARTELIRYLDADGQPQFGVLYQPTNGARPAPTVFLIYETFFDDTFDAVANLLASRGYAVVKPSVRLETGHPGEAWLKGVTAAANHLIGAGVADSARLGVHGTSYGGYATNLLVAQTGRFKAAINISGKVDIISFYTDSPRLGTRNTHAAERSQDRIGATLWEAPLKYVEHSAVMYADRITTPLLLMTGGEDHNVPAINTREMYYALRRLGKEVAWVNYVNGGHGTPRTTEAEFTHFHETLTGWYDRWLTAADTPPTAPVR